MEYTWESPSKIDAGVYANPEGSPEVAVNELDTGFAIPLYMSKNFRLFSGVNASWHNFNFSDTGLNDINTFDISVPFNAMVPINDKLTFMAIIAPGIHSDLKRVNYKDFKFSFLVLVNYSFNEKLQLSIGAAYSRIFGDDRLFPAAGLTWMPGDAWTIRLVFPKPAIIYHYSPRLRFMLGAEPAGGEWNIEDPRDFTDSNEEYVFEFKGWRAGFGAEYDITKKITFYADAGSTFGRSSSIDNDEETILDTDIDNTPGIRLGIQLHRYKINCRRP
jgi:hypothetical protein